MFNVVVLTLLNNNYDIKHLTIPIFKYRDTFLLLLFLIYDITICEKVKTPFRPEWPLSSMNLRKCSHI